jgi:hypothetical protein
MALERAAAVLCVQIALSPAVLIGQNLETQSGLALSVDVPSGYFRIDYYPCAWRFSGRAGSPLGNLRSQSGSDSLGGFSEVSFDYSGGARRGTIRVYDRQPVVLFTDQYLQTNQNTTGFPIFREYPKLPYHQAYTGMFAGVSFQALPEDSPWTFFDDQKNTWILAPILHPNVERQWISAAGELATGVDPSIRTISAGRKFSTLLVLGHGINTTGDLWGDAMQAVTEKQRPASDADITLRSIGYWTDNGSAYYYRSEPGKTITGTLASLREEFTAKGVQLGYLQLDSWHYPKGPNQDWTDLSSGIWEYQPAPELFPGGLKPLSDLLQIPFVVHARWIDKTSPYRTRYRMSRNVVTDPLYYRQLAAVFRQENVAVYEQDWLGSEANPDSTLDDPDLFFGSMASELKDFGIQYCMALPRHILKSAEYENVTTIRGSQDRLRPDRWPEFHYASRLIRSAGKWPFADVFRSSETGNLLVALLSAGPVGIGDAIGELDSRNLRMAARRDGVLVKPDVPAVPTDETILAEARGSTPPMMVTSHTEFAGYRASYVLTYSYRTSAGTIQFSPSSLGAQGRVYVLDYLHGSGFAIDSAEQMSFTLSDGLDYRIVYPILDSGIALFGDLDHPATLGRSRISRVDAAGNGGLSFTVEFAAGEESRVIGGYADSEPEPAAISGSIAAFSYVPANQIYFITVRPDRSGTAKIELLPKSTSGPAATLAPIRRRAASRREWRLPIPELH